MSPSHSRPSGWTIVWAAFTIAVFGWGVGFYGPPVFLHAVVSRHGWPLDLVSTAVTVHYLVGAAAVTQLPRLYDHHGLARMTIVGGFATVVGLAGWSLSTAPWQLFIASLASGLGWALTGAFAINMMVSPWFDRRRPAALSLAYNGASVGGVVFSPLWLIAIERVGFPTAAIAIGLCMGLVLLILSKTCFGIVPTAGDVDADRRSGTPPAQASQTSNSHRLPVPSLWRDRRFLTYVAGFSLGLFVQVGVIAHLVSLLIPTLGAAWAGLAAGFATACAIAGRTLVGWFMPPEADRRIVAAATYAVQACGCLLFAVAGGDSVILIAAGIVLFGLGIGNVTSLPPLIAQAEFARADVARVVAYGTAVSQATYAFAPAVFGLIRTWTPHPDPAANPDVPLFFVAAAFGQVIAAFFYLAGRPIPERR
ncbi:MAG: MFS transporter [Pseudomonadota bacterium]